MASKVGSASTRATGASWLTSWRADARTGDPIPAARQASDSVIRIVCPSGSARDGGLPTAPPAPPRFSTTTGCPRIFSSAAAIGRAARSACPPGGKGTIIVSVREGQPPCAQAAAGATSGRAEASPRPFRMSRRFIASLPRPLPSLALVSRVLRSRPSRSDSGLRPIRPGSRERRSRRSRCGPCPRLQELGRRKADPDPMRCRLRSRLPARA